MDLHKNARSSPASRTLLVERVMKQGWTVQGAADAAGMSERRAYVWLAWFRAEGHVGLRDRSSRPRWIPHQTSRNRLERALALRSGNAAVSACRGALRGRSRWVGGEFRGPLRLLARLHRQSGRRVSRPRLRPGSLWHVPSGVLGGVLVQGPCAVPVVRRQVRCGSSGLPSRGGARRCRPCTVGLLHPKDVEALLPLPPPAARPAGPGGLRQLFLPRYWRARRGRW